MINNNCHDDTAHTHTETLNVVMCRMCRCQGSAVHACNLASYMIVIWPRCTLVRYALRIAGLRKVYPPKSPDAPPLEAVKTLSVRVGKGELFGLLGANGAGKTTAISMVMRAAFPTAGGVHVAGHSVLRDFSSAATCLGVVTQSNTLWDRLSCKDHLRLFARVRGVPAKCVEGLVASTIADMELAPYADKLGMQLSGGMKVGREHACVRSGRKRQRWPHHITARCVLSLSLSLPTSLLRVCLSSFASARNTSAYDHSCAGSLRIASPACLVSTLAHS